MANNLLRGSFNFGYGSLGSGMTGHNYYLAMESMRHQYNTQPDPQELERIKASFKPGLFGAMAARNGGRGTVSPTPNSTSAAPGTSSYSQPSPAPSRNSGLRAVDFDPVPRSASGRWLGGYTSDGRYIG